MRDCCAATMEIGIKSIDRIAMACGQAGLDLQRWCRKDLDMLHSASIIWQSARRHVVEILEYLMPALIF